MLNSIFECLISLTKMSNMALQRIEKKNLRKKQSPCYQGDWHKKENLRKKQSPWPPVDPCSLLLMSPMPKT